MVLAKLVKINCKSLRGLDFNSENGVLNWRPDYFQSGPYEIKIIGIILILFAVIFSQLAPLYDKKKYGRV